MCPKCKVAITALGADSLAHSKEANASNTTSAINFVAQENLRVVMLEMVDHDKSTLHAVHDIKIDQGSEVCLCEWGGYPNKADWTWEPIENISKLPAFTQFKKPC